MPNSKRKILTPMWQEGNVLRTYKNYQEKKTGLAYSKDLKRVWVGLDKGLSQSDMLSVDSQEDWIFSDLQLKAGYQKVKEFNTQLTK